MFNKLPIILLFAILILGFIVRLYKIDNPVADWHSWRQADTAAVARNFYKEGFNPFLPRYDDMSGVGEKGIPNIKRYRMVEFPIYGSLVYLTYLLNGGVDERLARIVNIFFSLGSAVFVYLIARRYFGILTGLVSSLIFTFLPFNIFFSRVILPEPSLVFFSLGMFLFLNRWIFEYKLNLLLFGVIFGCLAFLTKPMAIFYLLPLIYSFYQKEGSWLPIPKRYIHLFFIFVPFLFWRIWVNQYPEGIPQSAWLFNGNGIRFRPAFWRWIIGDRFGREILSAPGTFLFFLGILIKPRIKESWLLHLLAVSSLLFLVVFATGNVQHDYYQILIIPALAIFTARGVVELLRGVNNFLPRIWTIPLSLFFLGLTFYLTWMEVKGLYQINNYSIVIAGRAADKLLPKEAVVIAPYGGDTAFLYQINRPGFPLVISSVSDMVARFGVTHFVSVTQDAKTKWLMQKYTVIDSTPSYVIIDLKTLTSPEDSVEPS